MEFRYLDGFSDYGVTRDGGIYNHKTGNWIGTTKPNVYVTVHMRNDSGEVWTGQRHRVVAELYLDPPEEGHNHVNHKDGIKGNDCADNLEWVTCRKNQWHAGEVGLTDKCIPVSTRNIDTGEVIHYPSATFAGEVIGISKDRVLWRLSKGDEKVWPERLQYRKKGDIYRPWPAPVIHSPGVSREVFLRDLTTSKVIKFNTQKELSEYLGICEAVISQKANDPDQPLISGRYQIKTDAESPWRPVEDPFREIKNNTVVVVTNTLTGNISVFKSAADCAREMGISKTALNYRLNCGFGNVFKDHCTYRRY